MANVLEGLRLRRDPAAKTESYYCRSELPAVRSETIRALKAKLRAGGRTVRICLHSDSADSHHDMVVVHRRGGVFRPHKHLTRDESYHMIEGRMRIDVYDARGGLKETIRIGAPGSRLPFLARVRKNTWHATVPETEYSVFHESRSGPFDPADSVFPAWA